MIKNLEKYPVVRDIPQTAETLIDFENLIVKHWGKLIVTIIIVTLLINYKDVSNGFMDGFRDSYYGKNKTQTK